MRFCMVAIVFLLLCPLHPAYAGVERYALLVGVDEYAPPLPKLEGARNDVTALREVLVSRWAFPREQIKVLLGADATRLGILNAITALLAQTKPDDIVFVYFAGHGTSAENRAFRIPLPHTTGALLPADFRMGDPKGMLETLIIGRRDIRPALEALDRGGRRVFVAIDACYSGNTVRGRDLAATGRPPLSVRHVELPIEADFSAVDTEATNAPYPYRNVVYMSAAAENEAAGEVSSEDLKFYPTLDGKPHGAFTDALIRALSDQLPTKMEGASYYQVHAAIRAFMEHAGYQQSPQLLPVPPKDGAWAGASTLFASSGSSAPVKVEASVPAVRMKLLGASGELQAAIGGIQGVAIVDARPDLVVVEDRSRVKLLSAGGDAITNVAASDTGLVLQAIKQQVWLRGLVANRVSRRAGLALEFDDNNLGSTRRAGDRVGFRLVVDHPAYLVLVNVDPAGAMRILYPAVADEIVRSPAGQVLELAGTQVVAPFGVESIVAFAFPDEPAGAREYAGKEMTVDSAEWRTFVAHAQSDKVSVALMQTVTSP